MFAQHRAQCGMYVITVSLADAGQLLLQIADNASQQDLPKGTQLLTYTQDPYIRSYACPADGTSLPLSLRTCLPNISSITASSASAPKPHPRTSNPPSPALPASAARSSPPAAPPNSLQLMSNCCSRLFDLSKVTKAGSSAAPAPLLLKFSRSKGHELEERAASHTALQPSSPSLFSRRFKVSKLLLLRMALERARPPSAWIWLSDKSRITRGLLASRSFARARTPLSAICRWTHTDCRSQLDQGKKTKYCCAPRLASLCLVVYTGVNTLLLV